MASVTVKTAAGKDAGSVELDAGIFGVQPNVPVMHQVVTAQLAARRAGTQSTKTRAEVSGGGRKPFKQKGTGNARQGSTRAPHFSGGGVALGPKPRKYDQKTPKKMIRLALRSALSDRANEGKVVVVDDWGFSGPKTKDAVAALSKLGIDGKALVVVDIDDTNTIKSFLNIQHVQLIETAELNAYDVLCNEYVVFTTTTLPTSTKGVTATTTEGAASDAAPATPTKKAGKKAAAAKQDTAAAGTVSEAAADDAADITDAADTDAADITDAADTAAADTSAIADAGTPKVQGFAKLADADADSDAATADADADSDAATADTDSDTASSDAGATESGDDSDDGDGPSADKIGTGEGRLPKGAVEANEDGTSPYKTYTIKGNGDSGYYHTTDSPYYERTKAEFWFKTVEAAKEAGFELPPSLREGNED